MEKMVMTELQTKQLQMLLAFDDLCKRNKIKYFLGYGTALGAVRHKGFIPWDDDVDVIMLREDYNRICELKKEEFPAGLFLQTVYTDSEYPYPFAKLRDVNTTFVEKGYGKLNICHGIYIDIFPLDTISSHFGKRIVQYFLAEYIWAMTAKYRITGRMGKMITNILNWRVPEEKYLRRIHAAEKKIILYGEGGSKVALLSYGGRAKDARDFFSLQWFEPVMVEFEGYEFPITREIDQVLTKMYGNYMQLPPEKDRTAGHEAEIIDCKNSYKQYM